MPARIELRLARRPALEPFGAHAEKMIAVDHVRLSARAYHRLFWWWFAFGFPAFASVDDLLADDRAAANHVLVRRVGIS
jgi:hypothetical protein